MAHEEEVKMAQLTYQFMQRVQLQGNEVPTFNQVVNWLASKAQPLPPPEPPKEEEDV